MFKSNFIINRDANANPIEYWHVLQTIQEGGSRAGSPQEGVATYSYSQQACIVNRIHKLDCLGVDVCNSIFSGGCEVVCPLLFSIHQLCPGCNLHIKLFLFIHWELPDPPEPTAAQQHLNIWTATTPECSGQAWYTVMTLLINVVIVIDGHKIRMLAKVMTRDTVPH